MEHDIFEALPAGYETRTFTQMKKLKQDALHVLNTLIQNGDQGNQFLVVRGLTKPAIERLDNDKSSLEVTYRFQWDGSVGIIKIQPSAAPEFTTMNVVTVITDQLSAMGTPMTDGAWGGTTTYKPQPAAGKQADQIFVPGSRRPRHASIRGWPTLVIETGVSESYTKLQADAKWWFANSLGDVRIVIVIVIGRAYVKFEKWQLVPQNAPRPVTRAYINQLRANPAQHSPTVTQAPPNRYAYSAHEVIVTETTVTDDPMILPFEALYERPPGPTERDFIITSQMFREIVDPVF
ncbi:uncharacterized protein CDV56_108288 [Aspergillus thermomutatus]|uniref:Uncharacterized protein n=1 Tax=Aspergillus thermomutatus TaxID=41047 RepID=A0A397HWB9_ASPTH|nr:uncharacterized protein CDV56_108288 [Aspergillus thermomutatus]RHZ67515.1 hypothetical protein CDV56_108288 [Aspergillus thermomutatus]